MARGKFEYWLTEDGLTLLREWARDGMTDSASGVISTKNVYAKGGKCYWLNERLRCCNKKSIVEACFWAVLDMVDSMPAVSPPPNDPLTLDELREMDGEPVWCAFSEGRGCYMIIQWHNSEFFKSFECGFLLADEYGNSWLAYRRKPEEN